LAKEEILLRGIGGGFLVVGNGFVVVIGGNGFVVGSKSN
jgi:hypothetical protein